MIDCQSGAEGGANIFKLDYFGNEVYLAQFPQLPDGIQIRFAATWRIRTRLGAIYGVFVKLTERKIHNIIPT